MVLDSFFPIFFTAFTFDTAKIPPQFPFSTLPPPEGRAGRLPGGVARHLELGGGLPAVGLRPHGPPAPGPLSLPSSPLNGPDVLEF